MRTEQTSLSNSLISVEQLSWQTEGKLILDKINFSVAQGSFTGLLGPNGAGKSSLLRCLYRFVKPDAGQVILQQQDIWQISANDFAQQVAVVLQESPSHFNLTVFDVVALGLIPHKGIFTRAQSADNDKISQAIAQVGLADKTKQSFEHLSGGEKQRALIARAIVQMPSVLIMDEPTSHLDVRYQIQVMELAKSLGITIIASFHDLNLASAMCDNLLVINQGKLVSQGSPKKVINAQMLSDVFGVCAQVNMHPQHNVPHITYFYDYFQQADHSPTLAGARHD
ncbi:ABC transporter ATP-binding protein [Thalassotalea sp. PLHSN55]|uniref:ABC transporter ATP-binding protein n=1 Tax=Thalassotalea sp. PLHSN55 TaxID=3435888 RepID=UPI003F82BFE3